MNKKLIFIALFLLMFGKTDNLFAQVMTVFEHSNSFEDITRIFQVRAKDISLDFNYFGSDFVKKYVPVLNDENKNIVGEDKFVILWLGGSEVIDINFLWLCNMQTNEAILFSFRKEYLEGHIPCSLLAMSSHLTYHIINVYKDPKWYQKPQEGTP
jgi:hypothetical protein